MNDNFKNIDFLYTGAQAVHRWTLIYVFVTRLRIFKASNDVGPLFVGPGSTQGKKQNGGVLQNFLLLSISPVSEKYTDGFH